MFGYQVLRISLDGAVEVVAEPDDNPGGLGFMPDGTPLVALRFKRQLAKLDLPFGTGRRDLTLHADLNLIPSHSLNDMVMDDTGRAYVGLMTASVFDASASGSDLIYVVDPDGSARVAARNVVSPNGMAISPDRRTLVVAATHQHRLTAMTIEHDGTLADPRSFADIGSMTPDGICIDAEGAVWFGGLDAGCFYRVAPGGAVLDTVSVDDRWAIACVLGGADRRTLFMTTARATRPVGRSTSVGRIEFATVEVPGAGWP
jgi:sugar lactone lactonase YvrE